MKLTKQQQSVMDRILYFLESDASVFVLKGYAGTGKTTMVKEIVKRVQEANQRNAFLMAPTGRDARVLQEKTGYSASSQCFMLLLYSYSNKRALFVLIEYYYYFCSTNNLHEFKFIYIYE